MKLCDLQPLAGSLVEQLRSACLRIEVAGSVRRGKPEPKDIELVAIPATGHYAVQDLFGGFLEDHLIDHLQDAMTTLLDLGEWELDPVVRRNGPRYKRLRHVASGAGCDLFITDPRRWGLVYTIRTGPADFSKTLMAFARRQTMFVSDGLLHRHPALLDAQGEARPCPAGDHCAQIIETPEERDVFSALGLPWIEPPRRSVNLLYASVPRGAWR